MDGIRRIIRIIITIIDYSDVVIRIWINCLFLNPALRLLVTVQTFATYKNNQGSWQSWWCLFSQNSKFSNHIPIIFHTKTPAWNELTFSQRKSCLRKSVYHFMIIRFKNTKNTHRGMLLLVKLQLLACNFTNSNTPPWVSFTFLKFYKKYQIAQSVSCLPKT